MCGLDFEYDGLYLSDFGYIICNFNGSSEPKTVSAGSTITFNTVPNRRGKRHCRVGSQFDSTIQSTFQICKNPETYDDMRISNSEYREMMRWLNRHEFHKFQFLYDDLDDPTRDSCYFNASFNISKITVDDVLYGLELTMETDMPFGYGREQSYLKKLTNSNSSFVVYDLSDDIGYTFVSITTTCSAAGDLIIENMNTGHQTIIKNCSSGEVISIDGNALVVTSSIESRKICKDFNFVFPRVCNTVHSRENVFTVSLPCQIELTYTPNIKDVF